MAARKRFEILVRTCVSPAVLARLRVALTSTLVPRNTIHRLRVPGDRDITEVVRKLTERDVLILEVRRSTERPRRVDDDRRSAEVIVPFRSTTEPAAPSRPTVTRAPSTGRGVRGATVLPLVRPAAGSGVHP